MKMQRHVSHGLTRRPSCAYFRPGAKTSEKLHIGSYKRHKCCPRRYACRTMAMALAERHYYGTELHPTDDNKLAFTCRHFAWLGSRAARYGSYSFPRRTAEEIPTHHLALASLASAWSEAPQRERGCPKQCRASRRV